jgi:hypothetical protein
VVDENAPHHLRRNAEELRTVLPDRAVLVDQSQVGFVDERGWLQRVFPALTPQMVRGAATQLLIHEGHEPVSCTQVAIAPGAEQRRDLVTRRIHRRLSIGWPADAATQGRASLTRL